MSNIRTQTFQNPSHLWFISAFTNSPPVCDLKADANKTFLRYWSLTMGERQNIGTSRTPSSSLFSRFCVLVVRSNLNSSNQCLISIFIDVLFPWCHHSFHIKDPAEFEFFLLGFLCPQGKYFRVFWLGMSSDSTLLWTVFLFLSYMSVCFFSALCSAILDPLFPCEKKHLPSVRKAVGVSCYL